jgi:hypothetical protein
MCGFMGSKDMPEPHQLYSLPFDEEIVKQDNQAQNESLEEWYKKASQELTTFNWPSKN